MTIFRTEHKEGRGLGSWSRARWLVVSIVLAAVAVAAVLAVVYAGGGSGAGGY